MYLFEFLFSTASNSNIKLKVELDNVPIGQCNTVYRSQNVVLTEKQLCAGGQPRKDSCRGVYAERFSI